MRLNAITEHSETFFSVQIVQLIKNNNFPEYLSKGMKTF